LWAAFYRWLCFPLWESAFYFSTSSYATVGYGDIVLPQMWRTLGPVNMKGLAPFWTKAKYGKMSIKGRDLVDTQTSHHSETRAIHNGKILVTPGNAKVPRDLKVRQSNRLDHRYPAPQAFPKSLRSFVVKLVVKQRPCFDQNVIRAH